MRKQKRAEKGKRNADRHQKKRPLEPTPQPVNKRQKKEAPVEKKLDQKEKPDPKKSTEKSSAEAMKRLSKSNPSLYKLLQSDQLIDEQPGSMDDDFAEDDRDIAYWEKKLGLDKKKNKKLGKDFEDDGLLDVLGTIDGDGHESDDDQAYLRKKRQQQAEKRKHQAMEDKAEEVSLRADWHWKLVD